MATRWVSKATLDASTRNEFLIGKHARDRRLVGGSISLGRLFGCTARPAHPALGFAKPLNDFQQPQSLGRLVVKQIQRVLEVATRSATLSLMNRLLDNHHCQR
ncbi:hypothetical protein SAMN06295970_1353 [Noviherbaspirillum suwonense]|uniref:Uncharacterized protein n=1 Tax=Noviherbaspirillum suwonense TaxID=1224511 RepID=A0ABY1QTT8_9BURK|nr:hypothetical protein SAMN06295970_1353 [Noviherbaspirillum suwonense]